VQFEGFKKAAIRVLDPREAIGKPPEGQWSKYAELIVVHELVHVSVWPVAGGDQRDRRIDSAVEDIAEALLFGSVPACATARDFMEAEIVSLPVRTMDDRMREEVIRKLTAAFLAGRPSWASQHRAACAATIKNFFARSAWR
jgi:hypothetical protein